MPFYADLHIHSRFSRATSSRLVPEVLDRWARVKGLAMIGTGDFTHPGWLSELKEKLVPAEEGLFVLSPAARQGAAKDLSLLEVPNPPEVEGLMLPADTRFVLSAEISTIYSAGGKVRKVHHVVLAPSFQAVDRIRDILGRLGNLNSDGRPILGIDSRDLLEIVLEADPTCVLVPAHVWTPWFSVLGSKSGFDSVQEAYRDLADHVFAIETGLSSDPPMNWICSGLDSYAILSNSDAHSPEHLGREANRFDMEFSYPALVAALREAAGKGGGGKAKSPEEDRTGHPPTGPRRGGWEEVPGEKGFLGTVEFFPQEGKYHFDGHRKCGVALDPVETARLGGLCPACGKPLTVGVMNRVLALADRTSLEERPRRTPFVSLVPLREILSELLGVGPSSRAVEGRYRQLVASLGPELWVLSEAPLDRVARIGGKETAEAVRRVRERRVHVEAGYDGEYGRVRVFALAPSGGKDPEPRGLLDFDLKDLAQLKKESRVETGRGENPKPEGIITFQKKENSPAEGSGLGEGLNHSQRKAVEHEGNVLLILAGPGTGKTHVLTHRIARLIQRGASEEGILALTFSRKAAEEMRLRITRLMGREVKAWIGTFHLWGLQFLKKHHHRFGRDKDFFLLSEKEQEGIMEELGQSPPAGGSPGVDGELSREMYKRTLQGLNAFDLEDLLDLPIQLLEKDPLVLSETRAKHAYLFVDEYQDVNEKQYRLLRLLAPTGASCFTAIGDPDQAIYGFRGANVAFIRRFTEDYPGAAVVDLETSYRCPNPVLKASRQVLERNGGPSRGAPVRPLAGVPLEVKVQISEHPSDAAEAEHVARMIEGLLGGTRFFSFDSGVADPSSLKGEEGACDPGEIAVMCRISRQMEPLEKAFQDHAIPYVKAGERSFLQEEPIASLLQLLRIVGLPPSPLLFRIGDRRIQELQKRKLALNPPSLQGLISLIWRQPELWWGEGHSGGRAEERGLFSCPCAEVLPLLGEALGVSPPTHPEWERLLSFASGLTVEELLARAALGSAQDDLPYRASRVTLSTLHAVKGLEFSHVFITGCEEGLIPYTLFKSGARGGGTSSDTEAPDPDPSAEVLKEYMEEERRLLYVGMTRAKKSLHLTRAQRRRLFGRMFQMKPSSFLQRIEEELLERVAVEKKARPRDPQLSLF